LFPPGTRPADFLARYAEVFNSVEGNTTFYALPARDAVARWRAQVPPHFRFCFKFPRAVSHDRMLVGAGAEVRELLTRLEPLGALLGTLWLQLPSRFGPSQLPQLRAFLRALPPGLHYAVELRHEQFFAPGPAQAAVVDLLGELGVDLVLMDARGVHSDPSPAATEVRGRKPSLPVVMLATARRPIVRCVPHSTWSASAALIAPWATQVSDWIRRGLRPTFFVHAPDDTFAPENAYQFHAMLRRATGGAVDVGELPPWPGAPRQLELL
jgi:uncharacterized protein YecE (DUF72 family)